jgi:hypothetical protein
MPRLHSSIVHAATVLAGVLLASSPAPAQFVATPVELLTEGRTAMVRHRAGKPTKFVLRAKLSGRAANLLDPTCPAASTIELSFAEPPTGFQTTGVIDLPCDGWTATKRGYRFAPGAGQAGGITKIVYGPKRLVVRAEGDAIDFIAGPVAYLQTELAIGGDRVMVRMHDFKRNQADRIVARRATKPAALGEAAFWDTIWGDDPREAEALELLEKAVKRRKTDGRSHFLLGMLELYRLQGVDPFDPTPEGSQSIQSAQMHLDAAVELLPHDGRVPGFRAATTYTNGVAHMDDALRDLGFEQMKTAVEEDPLFNSFDFFAIAPIFDVPGSSEVFQTYFVDLADLVLIDNLDCPTTRPDVCGNLGMAPHNVEGTFVLLGDLYTKGGRPADAEQWWTLGRSIGMQNGYAHLDLFDERIGTAAARTALYADADPTNDPLIMDGTIGYCRFCHTK